MDRSINLDEFSEGTAEQAICLKEHIASGAKNVWAVYNRAHTPSGQCWQFDNYQVASNKFDSLPVDGCPSLVLYTRVGTAVLFRYKRPKET